MARDFSEFRRAKTGIDPIEGHVAHIRHLSRSASLESTLREQHGFSSSAAKGMAPPIVSHLQQGLEFHQAALLASTRIRPVLQYYAYLNLAVACVLIYRPPNWQDRKSHGASDLSWNLSTLGLKSHLVSIKKGMIPAFHGIISDTPLPSRALCLRDLLIPISMVSSELEDAFGIRTKSIEVSPALWCSPDDPQRVFSSFILGIATEETIQVKRFPIKRINRAITILKNHYTCMKAAGLVRQWISKTSWPIEQVDQAKKYHQEQILKIINFGSYITYDFNKANPTWVFDLDGNTPVLPTISASLILSFSLACLARYRPHLLDRVENSKLNLIFEVFMNEADIYMIPAFRNLLYGEVLFLQRNLLA